MNSRERILKAINHEKVDRIPMNFLAEPEVYDMLRKYFRVGTNEEVWEKLRVDKIASVFPVYPRERNLLPSGEEEDCWGVRRKPQEYEYGVYWEVSYYPLKDAGTIEDVEKHRWPSADDFDLSRIEGLCEKYAGYVTQVGNFGPFSKYIFLRTLEKTFVDFALNPDLAHHVIKKIADLEIELMTRIFEAGKGKIDIACMADDFGSQQGLLISPEMWRTFFREPMKRMIKVARQFGVKLYHHDDGAIRELLPEMVELGIDVLDPVQWRCPGMDRAELKKEFGDRICFHGAMDNQRTLPFGSVEDVRQEVIENLKILAGDGAGYILAPCHLFEPNTSVENILAVYETGYVEGKV